MIIQCSFLILAMMIIQICAYTFSYSRACTTPHLINGRGNLRQRGKIMRYTCNTGFELVGNRIGICRSGEWDSPVPICAKNGCTSLERSNGDVSSTDEWASAFLNCQPGFDVAGSKWSYCNGTDWDRTLGTCRETQIGPATWCDFELEGICEWTSVDVREYRWKRFNNVERSYGLEHLRSAAVRRSGPRHDHTTEEKDGHFMVAQSSAFTPGDIARLLSPLYPANKSVNSCFRFYVFMYGRQSGRLRVFLKRESVGLDAMITNESYLLLELSGNYRNSWKEELIQLQPQKEEFQIVIEAMSGFAAYTDIAIDDVALLNGIDCGFVESSTPAEEAGGVFDEESCANRCNETRPLMPGIDEELITNQTGRGGVLVHCNCFDGCEEMSSCCDDYLRFCDADEGPVRSTIDFPVGSEINESQALQTTTATTPLKFELNKTTGTITVKATSSITNTKPTKATTKFTKATPISSQLTIALQTNEPTAVTTLTTSSYIPTPTARMISKSYSPEVFTTVPPQLSAERSELTLPPNHPSTSTWVITLGLIGVAAFCTFVLIAVVFRVYIIQGLNGNPVEEVRYLIDKEDILI